MTKRPLRPEEARAWARVAKTIKPIGPKVADLSEFEHALEAGEPVREQPPKPPRPSRPETSAARPRSPAPPAHRGSERKVRRGQLTLHAQFDLHGHTQATADVALNRFLERSRAEGARCVLIITGKGRGGEGVLRRNFLHWVQGHQASRLVSGYSEAHPRHGGSGAFYLFLRKAD